MRCFGSEGPSFPATRDWDAGAAAAIGAGESLVPVSLCLTSRSTRCSSSVAAAPASLRDGSMGQYLVPILLGVRPKCTDAQLQKKQLWTKEEEEEKHHRPLSLGAPEVTVMAGSSERE